MFDARNILPIYEVLALYLNGKQSINTIANVYGVSPRSVSELLKQIGIKDNENDTQYNYIVEMYNNKKSITYISNRIGIHNDIIIKILSENGVCVSKNKIGIPIKIVRELIEKNKTIFEIAVLFDTTEDVITTKLL